jgi:DNA-binding MarR family transcriptional regulator
MPVSDRIKQRGFASAAEEALLSMQAATGYLYLLFGRICDRHGITPDQYNVLRILRGVHPEGHPRYEIADRLLNPGTNVTRLLDRLEREGLVERLRTEEDRRLSISRITQAGLDVLTAIEPERRAMRDELARRLSEGDLRDLARICNTMVP